jgi:cytochrome c oxidase cbb3-type subunit II
MIRPMRDEHERYGHYSLAAESMYDHPFQWGSKRTGPDLARVGGRYSDDWHIQHFRAPRELVPESIMPAYPWFETTALDYEHDRAAPGRPSPRRRALHRRDDPPARVDDLAVQWDPDSRRRRRLPRALPERAGPQLLGFASKITELDAMLAYLQMLGTLVDFSTYEPDPNR